jgi:hypothetical protein
MTTPPPTSAEDALAGSRPADKTAASAPEAADWLDNPAQPAKRPSVAERLAQEPPWTGEEADGCQ